MAGAWDTEDEITETLQERLTRLRSSLIADKQPFKQAATPASWKPGQSGNPNGRPPKASCVTSVAKELLDKPADLPPDAPDFMEGWSWAKLIAYNFIVKTAKIDAPILKEFLDRTEGKVVQPVEASGKGGAPLFDMSVLVEKLKQMAGVEDE